MSSKERIERDSLGEKEVPSEAYYGIQTLRALENFPISGLRAFPIFVRATVLIKKAAAETHLSLGFLDEKTARAIVQAADEILSGQWMDQFVVDVFQAGGGTSHNMNVNEVIANRASELLGGKRGTYRLIHPNDHVNMSQSTNDVIPTAMRLAILLSLPDLLSSLQALSTSLQGKAREFQGALKAGRTHLQDATPITLGQEFSGYTETIKRDREKIALASQSLHELGIGGSAVGTGLNTHPEYRERMVNFLKECTGLPLRPGENLFSLMQSMADFAFFSASLRTVAGDLTQLANDLRLLSSGPFTGFGELQLPPVQPGSSIMPGKVNPSMAEMLNMVCFQVMGCDQVIAMAHQAGQCELNVMMPVIIFNILFSMQILKNGVDAFTQRCINGIQANEERCRQYAERSTGLAAALNPYIGYAEAAKIAQEAAEKGKTIREVVMEKKNLSPSQIDEIFSPLSLTQPNLKAPKGKN